jgi:hypothetical protein
MSLPDKDRKDRRYGILMVPVESRVGAGHPRPSPEVSTATLSRQTEQPINGEV